LQKIQELIINKLADKAAIRQRIVKNFAAQNNNLFLWVPFFIAVGIGGYFSLKTEPSFVIIALAWLVLAGCIVSAWFSRTETLKSKIILYALMASFLVSCGVMAAKVRTDMVYAPMILKKINVTQVEGVIEQIEPIENGVRLIIGDLEIEDLRPDKTPKKIRLTVRKKSDAPDITLKAGQRINTLAGLNPPSPPVAPNAFDFQRHAYFQGIGGVGFSFGVPKVIEATNARNPALHNLRQSITDKIKASTTPPAQGVIVALMTGQRKLISEDQWQAMRNSGLAHMLAISGLHVGMVAGVLFFFSRLLMAAIAPLALKYPIKKYAAIIALIGTFFYMLIVGAPIPTQRAMIMTGLALIAICFDRSPFSLRLVAVAAAIILLYRPESLVSVSFQMSFAAVTALVAFFEAIRPYWRMAYSRAGIVRKCALYFIGLSFTTIVAGTVTGIFALYHFQNYAAFGLVANLMAVPLLSIIVMPLVVLAYVLMPFGVEGGLFPIIEYGVEWILAIASWVGNVYGSVWHMATFPSWIFILMVITLWMAAVWVGARKRIILLAMIMLFGLTLFVKQPDIQFSSDSKMIAIRTDDGSFWLSTKQNNRFTAENWLRANGTPHAKTKNWPKEGDSDGFPLTCDPSGCRGEIKGRKVSVSNAPKGLEEDCQWADIVLATHPVDWKNCKRPTLINFWDSWRNGAHAIWFMNHKTVIKNVEKERGLRPWTQTTANNRKRKD